MKEAVFTLLRQARLARDVWRMELSGDVSAITVPGQFVEIALDGFFLRRPISVCDCGNGELSLIYKVVGQGTQVMSCLESGASLNLLTGLGNGFSLAKSGCSPLLIGGGVGVPPLYFLARCLLKAGAVPTIVLGFNTAAEVFFSEEFRALGIRVIVCTADGTAGQRGLVTDVLPVGSSFVYACGPLPMLRALDRTLPCSAMAEFSMEERMGCGFGACMGCSIMTKGGARRVCKDGPVFPRESLLWE
ncbi:MAG: dihydroorotate dehydrogenase electron transfer subunit [Mailhella sp.]|nr:dihydroorotate dehydrogenase electron transfer subunit [Mailhella sp.]